jgi:hypothetical protein
MSRLECFRAFSTRRARVIRRIRHRAELREAATRAHHPDPTILHGWVCSVGAEKTLALRPARRVAEGRAAAARWITHVSNYLSDPSDELAPNPGMEIPDRPEFLVLEFAPREGRTTTYLTVGSVSGRRQPMPDAASELVAYSSAARPVLSAPVHAVPRHRRRQRPTRRSSPSISGAPSVLVCGTSCSCRHATTKSCWIFRT